jgi:hypothetical protein
MLKNVLKSVAPLAFAVFVSTAAVAQPPMPPLPRLEIRIAQQAPPRVQAEKAPRRPDRESVWIKGAWGWDDGRWGWAPGRWERPENRHSKWIAARNYREGNVWRHEPGHWSHQKLVEGDDYRRWKEEHHR